MSKGKKQDPIDTIDIDNPLLMGDPIDRRPHLHHLDEL